MTPVDPNGRVKKVGTDVHSRLCWDGKRVLCLCGKELRDQEARA